MQNNMPCYAMVNEAMMQGYEDFAQDVHRARARAYVPVDTFTSLLITLPCTTLPALIKARQLHITYRTCKNFADATACRNKERPYQEPGCWSPLLCKLCAHC